MNQLAPLFIPEETRVLILERLTRLDIRGNSLGFQLFVMAEILATGKDVDELTIGQVLAVIEEQKRKRCCVTA